MTCGCSAQQSVPCHHVVWLCSMLHPTSRMNLEHWQAMHSPRREWDLRLCIGLGQAGAAWSPQRAAAGPVPCRPGREIISAIAQSCTYSVTSICGLHRTYQPYASLRLPMSFKNFTLPMRAASGSDQYRKKTPNAKAGSVWIFLKTPIGFQRLV